MELLPTEREVSQMVAWTAAVTSHTRASAQKTHQRKGDFGTLISYYFVAVNVRHEPIYDYSGRHFAFS